MSREPRIVRSLAGLTGIPQPEQPSITEVMAAAARLREGGLVAFPTETVYGLGADARSATAVAKVFATKGRPSRNPLIVHVSGPEMARSLASAWPAEAELLARRFWPGPLTLVLPRRPEVENAITAGGPTVALRSPDHPTAMALLFAFGGPLVGPSANRSGGVSPTTAAHVRAEFPPEHVTVLDGGPCTTGIESTVLSLADPDLPVILRPGVLGAAEIGAVLGRPVGGAARTSDTGPLPAPGMLEAHYAPRTAALMFPRSAWPEVLARHGNASVVLLTCTRLEGPAAWHTLSLPASDRAYAAGLYGALRDADALARALILVESPPTDSATWAAVHDRLSRATTRF